MGVETTVAGAIGKPLLMRGLDELDRKLALRAWLNCKVRMLPIFQHPVGYVLCPVCYGSETRACGPCPFCLIPGKPREAAGYVTPYYFNRHWDSPRWKPRREWAGFHITRPLPDAVVQGWTLRDQRTYRKGLEAPYKNWRTPYKAG
jgi:hypothetical protein